jgi:phage antirepressor YoqD-like protein
MENNIQVFSYNNNPVHFQIGDSEVMINATSMAKPFGKQPSDWVRLKQSKEFMSTLSAVRGICGTDLVQVVQGGNSVQGTWFHKDVAIEFARWLSPAFAIWCNDRIFELFRFGITATPEMLLQAASNPQFVLEMLNQVREGYEKGIRLQAENDQLSEQLEEQAYKVNFYDNVRQSIAECDSKRTYTATKIASTLGMKAADLNKILEEKGIQIKRGDVWVLTKTYQNLGYTEKAKKQDGYFSDSEPRIISYTVWTHKGREFILSLFEQVDANTWKLKK